MANFKSKFSPTPNPRNFQTSGPTFALAKDAFKPHTLLLLGALVQSSLCALFPLRWALLPAASLLLNSAITTLIQLRNPSASSHAAGVVPGRVTAQLPRRDGSYGGPADQDIVVFLLGMQINHPLGMLAPGVAETGARLTAMNKDLEARRDETGLLGVSGWRADERRSNNSLISVYHFRDLDSLHRFAHGPLHREGWDWFSSAGHDHIGIYHETFCVPAHGYETIYVNCRPVLLGQASASVEVDSEQMWLNSLVSADTPQLKTQYARMSRNEKGQEKGRSSEGLRRFKRQ